MEYIDIHGHYAWGIDDGIENKENAKKALQKAGENGIRTIVATPHIVPGQHGKEEVEKIRKRIEELKELGKNYNIEVRAGSELFLNYESIETLEKENYIAIEKTNYLLCEFDVRKELGKENEVEDMLYEIEIKNLIPIIAHIERYFLENVDIDRVRELINIGYVMQINTSSLMGVHGKRVKNNAYKLLDEGLVHVIASDTHRYEGQRSPNMKETYEMLSKRYERKVLKTLMYDNPLHIIKNEEVEKITVKKTIMQKLLRRR